MTERSTQTAIIAALSLGSRRLWRNNRGVAWIGESIALANGDVIIKNARRISFGLCDGASDLIGYRSVIVTPSMTGKQLAQFVALEIKDAKKYGTHEQRAFLQLIRTAGGVGEITRSVKDAETALTAFKFPEP